MTWALCLKWDFFFFVQIVESLQFYLFKKTFCLEGAFTTWTPSILRPTPVQFAFNWLPLLNLTCWCNIKLCQMAVRFDVCPWRGCSNRIPGRPVMRRCSLEEGSCLGLLPRERRCWNYISPFIAHASIWEPKILIISFPGLLVMQKTMPEKAPSQTAVMKTAELINQHQSNTRITNTAHLWSHIPRPYLLKINSYQCCSIYS